jgi:signal transduction histidine kinase
MDIVVRESERLNETIRSFLAYARPQKFAVARLDLTRLVRDTALLLRNGPDVLPAHSVDVSTPDAPVWYDADENQIRQILWNLATNGLRAMPDGGTLTLAVEQDGADAVVSVRDSGCGIAADQIDGMFQPFHGSFEKGSGLGLSIVHRIVSDYGGTIAVDSQPGRGTCMRIQLPARPAPGTRDPDAPQAAVMEAAR